MSKWMRVVPMRQSGVELLTLPTTGAAQIANLGQPRPFPSTSAPPASPPPSPPPELSPSSPRATAVGRRRHSAVPPCH